MSTDKEIFEYDEDDAVKFIRNFLPQEIKDKYTNDDINYLIDVVYEFYENKGFLDDSDDESKVVDIDEDEVVNYVLKTAQKDDMSKFTPDDISLIIQGELAYCDSIGVFED